MFVICIPLCCERVNPSFQRTSRPSRLTVLVLTTRISLSVASQFPDFRFSLIAPLMGISRLLKHLYFGEHLLRFIHLETLQLRSILSASSLMTKLLGLLISALQSISILLEVVRIYISSDNLGQYLAGFSFLNEFGMMKLTVFQLSKICWMKKVFSRSTVSSFASVRES